MQINKNMKIKKIKSKTSNIQHTTVEKTVIEIDYERLATSIIVAQQKVNAEKEKAKEQETSKNQKDWEHTLKIKENNGKNFFTRMLKNIIIFFPFWAGVISFDKKYAETEFGIYGLMRLFCTLSLLFFEICLTTFSFHCIYKVCVSVYDIVNNSIKGISIDVSPLTNTMILAIILFFFFTLLQGIIRIFRLKLENCTNKDTINASICLITAVDAIIVSSFMSLMSDIINIAIR